MLELFCLEAENQTALLTSGLLELEHAPATASHFEALMRAAHSLKGAARMANLHGAVHLAHAMEDCFIAAQHGRLCLGQPAVDLLLRGVDLLNHLSKCTPSTITTWERDHATELAAFQHSLAQLLSTQPAPTGGATPASSPSPSAPRHGQAPADATSHPQATRPAAPDRANEPAPPNRSVPVPTPKLALDQFTTATPPPAASAAQALTLRKPEPPDRVLRLTAENLNRLLALAGESLVESRWLRPFADSLHRLKRHHTELARKLDHLRQAIEGDKLVERTETCLNELSRQLNESQQFLAERMTELDAFDRRSAQHSQRLYLEVLRTRMRPFSDGVRRFPRMVRDLARALGKEVKLEISGENTPVDRDILERLETPLAHLLRNAVDHGCEAPPERPRAGKPTECAIRIEARHSAGVLLITVSDDGAGVDLEAVRRATVQQGLTPANVAEKLTESELLQFLFLPGFTLKQTVTEISGRGFGLDVVQNMIRSVRGSIRLTNQPGRGLRVQLQLPLTLSVLRALLVKIAGEPFAIPLSQITRTLSLPRAQIQSLEGHHHFHFGEQPVGLLTAHQILGYDQPRTAGPDLSVVVLGERQALYGVVVDRFLGERELVVQPLDERLGKIQNISAAALMEDGAPVLIVDVEDMLRSIERLIAEGRLAKIRRHDLQALAPQAKRILAVDDSLTVRELERKLLANHGYLADVAVDGMEAWNAVRSTHYDLVITDVDMPRMDGIELTSLIKKEPRLQSLPVLIVSYKDREEDRLRGLEAGADYYLTKGSFHDDALLQAVADLIGEPESPPNEAQAGMDPGDDGPPAAGRNPKPTHSPIVLPYAHRHRQ
jgi:two-component system, chemotaxis family, sensor histidine kinase and response regulator WspE